MKKYIGTVFHSEENPKTSLSIGIPMTGMLRSEWVMARYGQTIPTNWSSIDLIHWIDQYSPIGYSVADARNLIADMAIKNNSEWLFFIDHDVILPPGILFKINEYMALKKYPIVSGLYFTKSKPSEPLIYRGRGNSYYRGWTIGQKVWADGVGLGCALINVKILKAISEVSEDYKTGGKIIKKVFETPSGGIIDKTSGNITNRAGTEDLFFYDRLMNEKIYHKSGWPQIQKKKYPILVDTSMFCGHIDWSGNVYPSKRDIAEFSRGAPKAPPGSRTW
jgi:hypothetical protein